MFSRLQIYAELLKEEPMWFPVYILYLAVTILISLILHECAHGYVALRCGDPTAKMLGRLSLDPRKHLDPIGTASMILIGFGWAKPVPVNPRNFRNYRRDDLLVSVAGICVNLLLFFFCSALSVALNGLIWEREIIQYVKMQDGSLQLLLNPYYESPNGVNFYLASYLASPHSPASLCAYASRPWLLYIQKFLLMMASTNLGLAVFNLLPIPPLDGYHVVNDIFLKGSLQLNRQVFQIAQIALIVALLSGLLNGLLLFLVGGAYTGIVRLWLMIAGA